MFASQSKTASLLPLPQEPEPQSPLFLHPLGTPFVSVAQFVQLIILLVFCALFALIFIRFFTLLAILIALKAPSLICKYKVLIIEIKTEFYV